jgi:hypothetical protein
MSEYDPGHGGDYDEDPAHNPLSGLRAESGASRYATS